MSLVSFSNVEKFYGRQDVLRGATFALSAGERVGLVGRNGAGKTTVLRILQGRENPDRGSVHCAKRLRLGHLPQDLMTFTGQTLLELVMDTAEQVRSIEAELNELTHSIDTAANGNDQELLMELTERQSRLLTLFENLGGYQLETEARKIINGLGFEDNELDRPVETFSGGWIMRAVLARLLLAKPDLLLLDEPTNHLDLNSLIWLEGYLCTCPSALLLVSHDRVFLNNVVFKIIEIDRGLAQTFQGNYDQYLEEKEKRLTTEMATYQSQQDRIKQVEKFIERNRVRASTARRAQSRMKMLEKMDKVEAPVTDSGTSFKLTLPQPARGPEILVELDGVTKQYGNKTIYRDLDFSVRRGDRIAFLGPNGRGKSTLLKLLANATEFQEGQRRVGTNVVLSYFAQFQLEELNPDRTVLDELATVAGDMTPGRLRSILGGFMFSGEDVFKKVAVLSGGEKSRLILAKIMIVGPNLLLLDEPTNHLDIPGREMLEKALCEYTGTICLISHDRRLINAIANKVLVIKNQKTEIMPGNFDDYQRLWQEQIEGPGQEVGNACAASPQELQSGKGESRAEREARKRAEAKQRQERHRLTAPLIKEIEKLEQQQADLSARADELSEILGRPDTYEDPDRAKALNREYAALKTDIEQVIGAWEEASLKLEELTAEDAVEIN
jgi:ATP-binding cassette subfamily F protein 3